MPATHVLSDVDPFAICICKKGANNQRIFLRKSHDGEHDGVTVLPHRDGLLKEDGDWSAFYCVVAEPGAEENGGQGASEITDVWKDADEIRKAAHRFAKNQGYVNAMHGGLAEQGCTVVENAVALSDFKVGRHTIKKGSWYIAVEPSDAFRAAVDAGEITGVSIEGSGVREALSKAATMAHEPTIGSKGKGLFGMKGKQLPAYIQHVYNDMVQSGSKVGGSTYRKAVGIVQNWAAGHDGKGNKVSAATQAKAAAAIAEWEKLKAEAKATVNKDGSDSWLASMGLALGINKMGDDDVDDMAAAALLKASNQPRTFDGILAQRELDQQLPDAQDALRSVIWDAFYPMPDVTAAQSRAALSDSLDQFKDWLLTTFDGAVKPDTAAADDTTVKDTVMKEQLGMDPASRPDAGSLGVTNPAQEDTMDTETKERLDALAKSQEESAGAIATLSDLVGKLVEHATKPKEEDVTPDSLKKSLDEYIAKSDEQLTAIEKGIEALASSGSAQPDDGREPVKKSDNPLAGILA
ncbi:XkdF-like putative serine protease domain-containing protein [Mycobacterium sp.]|uniref:XkdF-like putative serine protease domain-containing protein n=1 Tax=Mycobacterium sp. TaxID=1785 RepID=UPI0026068F76|nr:XkdF-like putative serine protease domain-containing protein [Mycobacterium sp.]